LDKVLEHREELFKHLRRRWEDLFGVKFQVLLYDLTSTYFESDPPFAPADKRKYGYSRDKRSDCVQVVIALVVTPEGFPLAYEVMAGNTSDKTTLRATPGTDQLYGQAERIWVMDRGFRPRRCWRKCAHDPPIHYLVGTPKGRLTRYEKRLIDLPWRWCVKECRSNCCPRIRALRSGQSTDRVNRGTQHKAAATQRSWSSGLKELQTMELSARPACSSWERPSGEFLPDGV
jgi:hypothetical protein